MCIYIYIYTSNADANKAAWKSLRWKLNHILEDLLALSEVLITAPQE